MYAIMQINPHKYGHGETRNKKLIKRRNALISPWKKEGKKKGKKIFYYTGDSNLVTHPCSNPAEQGLTALSGRNMFLAV